MYKAEWNGKFVAVKKFEGTYNLKNRESFKKELDILSQIDCQNVVKVFGFHLERENTYIVSELMEGGSLDSLLHNASIPLNWKDALVLINGMVSGMVYLHDKNIVHLDLKSPNILLDQEKKQAKIADFGLAKISNTMSTTVKVSEIATRQKTAAGTFRWMSPEVSKGKEGVKKSDVWSFGCMLLEFVTRALPFRSITNVQAVYLMLQTDKAEIPINLDVSKTPKVIGWLIEKCLKRDANSRL